MKKHLIQALFILITLLSSFQKAEATHNRAGEITYRQIGPLTIEMTITTYTKTSGQSINADRPFLDINWGDGQIQQVQRASFSEIQPDIRQNFYRATHTYPGPNPGGQPYLMRMQDPNRNENILNINGGNSVNIEFYLQTEVYLFATSIFGYNSSPILLEPPIDFGVVGQVFQHTPNGYDPDGDSIAYELIVPMSDIGTVVPGYQLVTDIVPGPNNQFTFDVRTGLFTWTSPQKAGEYNIAILVKSYRNGLYMGGIVRDIQIEIRNAPNTPPIIQAPDEICVHAGTLIQFDVVALDSDIPPQLITLTATGGPLLQASSPATFTNVRGFSALSSTFRWQTNCSHIQQQPYQLVFKARDTFMHNGLDASLATFKVVKIRVIGPPPQNLQSNVSPGAVTLTWNSPYTCDTWAGFLGFSVWRKETCDNFTPDTCEIGLQGHGYTQINFGNLVKLPVAGQYTFTDNNVTSGGIYSYRVVGEFATPIANTTNFHSPVAGKTSQERCVQMAQDLPLMTNVDVEVTAANSGQVLVRWARPRANQLDTTLNIPPYRYELYTSNDLAGSNFLLSPIWTSPVYNSYSALSDTTDYLDARTVLNTLDNANSYRVAFYSNADTLGFTSIASSIYLTVNASDETNVLTWVENVPWINYRYEVFLESPTGSGTFITLDTVTTKTYTHRNLNNGETYCYRIRSTGTYGIQGVLDTLLNKSQIACGTPLDTLAPCPPIAVATASGCERIQDDANKTGRGLCEGNITPMSFLFNEIKWKKSQDSCASDVAAYRLYFSPYCVGDYVLVQEFTNLDDTIFLHQPSPTNLAGCYYVTAVDSIEGNGGGNESAPSEIVKTDNCPFYELPNVFTPNGDGDNDFFTPCLPYRYVSSVDFKVYNRWGQVVFETTDPEINWDGRDKTTGQILAEGVYYYTCGVVQNCMSCTAIKGLKGNIHIIRGSN